MPITGVSNQEKMYKKSIHWRNDSGELDVFEAARYFSGAAAAEVSGSNGATYTQKVVVREDGRQGCRGGGRISLDMTPLRDSVSSQARVVMEKQTKEKTKKCKQPSSPAGRLASFLNSLFNQTSSSKKKKSKPTTAQSVKGEDESPGGWRRKRRSSVSHFRSASAFAATAAADDDSKPGYGSTSSGFRTPPPYANTPSKAYKDFKSHLDHKLVVPLPKFHGHGKPSASQNGVGDAERNPNCAFLDEKLKFTNGFPSSKYPLEKKKFGKFNEVGDDGEDDSDSSSDLFELENYKFGYYASGLPVYETTHVDRIKRGAPISTGH